MQERAERWASTMAGSDSGSGVTLAHADSWAGTGSVQHRSRSEREEAEDSSLSRLATRSFDAGNRAIAEQADPFRTCFERDRDRILHAPYSPMITNVRVSHMPSKSLR